MPLACLYFKKTISNERLEIRNSILEAGKLKTPKAVLFATDEYRGEMDVIGNFIQEKCVQDKEMTITIKRLYKAYSD